MFSLQIRLKRIFLKGLADEVHKHRGRPLFFKYVGSGKGQGPYVELEDGSVKLDLINGIGIHILGHANPHILKSTVEASLSDAVMPGKPSAE